MEALLLENAYQTNLIKKLRNTFPGAFVLKNDTQYRQGIPDLLLLIGPHWVMLEVKRSPREPYRPNQEYYLELFNEMSFAATIFPENEDEVIDAIQQAFGYP